MAYATGAACATDCCDIPFSVEHVTQMVRHVYGERVNFYSVIGEIAPGVTVHRVGGHSTACRWSRSRPRAGRWCWRLMRALLRQSSAPEPVPDCPQCR